MIEVDGRLFDWDDRKNLININKHGISFQEAATVFSDTDAIEEEDAGHSQDEERFVILGKSRKLRLMVVCHCYRVNDSVIRIISARKANKDESETYGGAK